MSSTTFYLERNNMMMITSHKRFVIVTKTNLIKYNLNFTLSLKKLEMK